MTNLVDHSKTVEQVQALAEELFTLMGVKSTPSTSYDDANDAVVVDVQTEDETGLLIGSRGETLTAIQHILGLAFSRQADEWQRIIVNVADWRERQEDKLAALATQTADRALETGQPQNLYNLSAGDRRVIHMTLAERSDVETESVGEGKDRYLVVRPK